MIKENLKDTGFRWPSTTERQWG